HVDGSVNPARDIGVIDTELIFADLDTVNKRYSNIEKQARSGDKKAGAVLNVLSRTREALERGNPARSLKLSDEEADQIHDFHLITIKPVLYVANLDEKGIQNPEANNHFLAV